MRYFILIPLLIFTVSFPLFQISSLTVTFPNGGEVLYIDTLVQIKWMPPGNDNGVVIVLYKKGIKYLTIAQEAKDTGLYNWKIPTNIQAGKDYRIRIRLLKDLSVNDFSDRDFEIAQKTKH